jgi:hypothetical protein
MNKETLEEYLAESLAQLELARDHAANYEAPEAFNRLADLCQNVSDLLDEFEDDHLGVGIKPRYTSAQAQLLYDVLQQHNAASLQPALNAEGWANLDDALGNLRMELLACAALNHPADNGDNNTENYGFDDSVDGQ